jgi:hypothetical protein
VVEKRKKGCNGRRKIPESESEEGVLKAVQAAGCFLTIQKNISTIIWDLAMWWGWTIRCLLWPSPINMEPSGTVGINTPAWTALAALQDLRWNKGKRSPVVIFLAGLATGVLVCWLSAKIGRPAIPESSPAFHVIRRVAVAADPFEGNDAKPKFEWNKVGVVSLPPELIQRCLDSPEVHKFVPKDCLWGVTLPGWKCILVPSDGNAMQIWNVRSPDGLKVELLSMVKVTESDDLQRELVKILRTKAGPDF